MRKAVILFVTLALLAVISVAPAHADTPQLPHAFCGNVLINGDPALDGTLISATVSSGTAITNSQNPVATVGGNYGIDGPPLLVQGDIPNGAIITFYVNGVEVEGVTATFEVGGGPTQRDLSVTIPAIIGYSPSSFSFTATQGGADPPTQTLSISNTDIDPTAMDWSVTSDAIWLSLSPTSGSSSGEVDSVTVSVSISGMSAGSYGGTITISALAATNTPQTVAVSLTIAAPTPTPEGGGGAPPTYYTGTNLFGIEGSFRISLTGEILETITATSVDGNLTVTIPAGTIALDKDGNRLSSLTVAVDPSPPPPPEGAHIIGLAYTFLPAGATFDPPITLEYTYDPAAIPEGVAEEDLVLAYYDEATGAWVELPCIVDTVSHRIIATVSHFTTFAIIAGAPPPAPADFSLSNLTVQPAEVQPGEAVTVAVSVANTGGTEGSYTVVLKINGVNEAEKSVTIAAGGSPIVTFSVTKEDAASYSVTVDGLSGSFTVVPPPPPPAAFSVSNLTVQPAEVLTGEVVTISAAVANTGGTEGSYTVVLKINGVNEAEKSVTIAAGASETVTFSVTKEDAASYSVTVDGLSGSFTVVAPAVVTNWPLLGGIIAAVIVVGLLVFFLVFRRRAY